MISGPADNSDKIQQGGVVAILLERVQEVANEVILGHLWRITLLCVQVMVATQFDGLVAVLGKTPVA
jgi:hypothetical protein